MTDIVPICRRRRFRKKSPGVHRRRKRKKPDKYISDCEAKSGPAVVEKNKISLSLSLYHSPNIPSFSWALGDKHTLVASRCWAKKLLAPVQHMPSRYPTSIRSVPPLRPRSTKPTSLRRERTLFSRHTYPTTFRKGAGSKTPLVRMRKQAMSRMWGGCRMP